jgi:predicted dehydrogenase
VVADPDAATTKLRWGILGTGGIAAGQTRDLIDHDFIVAAVGSRTLESAKDFAGRYGIARAHGSYQELVADPEVDVIYVATPHAFHAENALLALNAGKHVLVEKAFTINGAQAREVVETAERNNLVVLEAMWTRYLPQMRRIRQIVRDGLLGTVRTVIADHSQRAPTDPAHRMNDPKLGGGALLDLGIYPVSLAFDVLGDATSVSAIASRTETGVDRQISLLLGFDENAGQAILNCALDGKGPNKATIIGTDGWLEIDSVWYAATGFTRYGYDGEIVERYESSITGRGMQFQAFELERLVAAGELANDILPPRQSVRIMETLDEARRQVGVRYEVD